MTDHDVTDYDPRVNEILERQVPLRLDAQPDWAGALRKAEDGITARPADWGSGLRYACEADAYSRLHSSSPYSSSLGQRPALVSGAAHRRQRSIRLRRPASSSTH